MSGQRERCIHAWLVGFVSPENTNEFFYFARLGLSLLACLRMWRSVWGGLQVFSLPRTWLRVLEEGTRGPGGGGGRLLALTASDESWSFGVGWWVGHGGSYAHSPFSMVVYTCILLRCEVKCISRVLVDGDSLIMRWTGLGLMEEWQGVTGTYKSLLSAEQ